MTQPVTDFDLVPWMYEHYDADTAANMMRCKRCRMLVRYVTKHAVERHGDNIPVLPALHGDGAPW